MSGSVNQKMVERARSEEHTRRRRRLLKQKVRRGEVLKLINLGIKRYDEKRRANRVDRRVVRALATRYQVWDLRLTNIAVSLRVIGQDKLRSLLTRDSSL